MMENYSCILVDPPWSYRVYDASDAAHGAARSHYDTQKVDVIQSLPIHALAAKDCALCMWATFPCLEEARQLMQAWGFTYKTALFVWVKLNKDGSPFLGLGHYSRANAEVCLLGTKGHVKRLAKDVPQVIMSRRRQHSRKPDEQYERIMRLFKGPYIEMYGRQQWPGWDVWGNQSGKFHAQPFLFSESEGAA